MHIADSRGAEDVAVEVTEFGLWREEPFHEESDPFPVRETWKPNSRLRFRDVTTMGDTLWNGAE